MVLVPDRISNLMNIVFAHIYRGSAALSRNYLENITRYKATQSARAIDQRRGGIASAGFAPFLMSRFISRQVASSVYVGENVCVLTHLTRSAAGKFDQSLLSCSRVRCSESRQRFKLALVSCTNPDSAAPRQLVVTSQLGTLSATASLGQNQMPAETVATAIINRRDMTISWTACKVTCPALR